jgi:hypothetical protein
MPSSQKQQWRMLLPASLAARGFSGTHQIIQYSWIIFVNHAAASL